MKQFTLLLLLLGITTTAFSQINKGQFLIGGNISFESIKNEVGNNSNSNFRTTNFFISPNVGYFIIEKLAGGIRFDFRSYEQASPNNLRQTNTSLSPFLRYYFLPSTKKINAFIDIGYLNYRTKFRNGTSSPYIERSNGYNISAGPIIFLTDQIALEFTVGYKHTISNNVYYNSSSIFSSGLGFQIHLGRKKIKSKK